MEEETVYGTHEDSHIVMSDKVQSLAGSIYQQFEKMMAKYDEEVVKELMPLVVNVLESLDLSYTENQEHKVELELVREDNEQLVTQYEREKQLRKATEQKLLEVEDLVEDERKEKSGKIESLESIVRMLELKAKNSSDHVYRLEEKEQEMKKEYAKLHERYTELFKTHMDYIERTKILMGASERGGGADTQPRSRLPPLPLNRSSGPVSFGFQSLERDGLTSLARSSVSPGEYPTSAASPDSNHSPPSLRNELEGVENTEETVSEKGWSETLSRASPDTSEESPAPPPAPLPLVTTPLGRTTTKKEQRSGNTLYQELSFQDAEALGEMDEGADITGNWVHPGEYASSGMGKEVENLIMENNELLATKNALNIVKDDLIIKVDELTSEHEILREELKSVVAVKERLKERVAELEDELKRLKEEADASNKQTKSDDEEDVPMAQRRRFTRVEMARVLMERNQYKERFMELQEAVRFTEMIRASQADPNINKKNKQSIWNFFSSLFRSSNEGGAMVGVRKVHPYGGGMRYNAPTHHISPALDTMRKRSMHDRKRGLELIDSNDTEGRRRGEAMLRGVTAHVRRDDGRIHAYGWSLPTRPPGPPRHPDSPHLPVPVPIYCRPLMEKEDGMKIWCAAAVNLAGGKTRDGGEIVGASVFYKSPPHEEGTPPTTPVEILEKDIEESEREREERREQLSSLVWICTSTRSVSYVTVIDGNNPADILEAFSVCHSYLLCIASVPGASEWDYKETEEEEKKEEEGTEEERKMETEEGEEGTEKKEAEGVGGSGGEGPEEVAEDPEEQQIGKITFVSCATGSSEGGMVAPSPPPSPPPPPLPQPFVATQMTERQSTPSPPLPELGLRLERRLVKQLKEGLLKDGVTLPPETEGGRLATEELKKMSSVLPTMWLGAQNGFIFVHSAVSQWRNSLHSIKLKDSVVSIVHVRGRVVCAVADCTVAVFRRGTSGEWDLSRYHVIDLGPPQHSIRCLVRVHNNVWCGYKNRIHVLDPVSMQILKSVEVHPRKESQVRQMAWVGDGVWVSIRLDSTLRLYHAHTFQHLQDVDIEPYVSKMLGTGKLGFSFVRITALVIASSRLWIGTGNGVIISVPLSDKRSGGVDGEGGSSLKLYGEGLTPASFIPYCSMHHAQLSFHGHRDNVKFFVAVPGVGGMSAATSCAVGDGPVVDKCPSERSTSTLVISGGEGYIDFRVGDDDYDERKSSRGDPSYLIVWQVSGDGASPANPPQQ